MEDKKQGVSLGVVIILALIGLFMGAVLYMYFKDLSTNKLVRGFELNLKSIEVNNQDNNTSNNSGGDIETFVDKIFLGNGLTQEALPEFNNILEADKNWMFSMLYYDLVTNDSLKYTYTYEEVQEELNNIIGKNTYIQFPQEGTDKIMKKEDKYIVAPSGLIATSFEGYTISNIGILNGNYIVTINEYKYQISEDNSNYNFIDKTGNVIKSYSASDNTKENWNVIEEEMKDYVKDNQDKFARKDITIMKDTNKGNLNIVSVKVKE